MESTIHGASVRGVGRFELPVPTIDAREAVESYLNQLSLTRRGSTEKRSRQILIEYQPFITEPLKAGVLLYLAACKAQGNCNRTLANKLVRIKAFYRTLGVKVDVPQPIYHEKLPAIYSPDDLTKFFAACSDKQKLYFKTLLLTGLRMQEARYLEFSDIEPGFVTVRAKDQWGWVPKTSEERRIPVPMSLTAELLATKGECSLVFVTKRCNPDHHSLRTCKRLAAKAGLDPKKWSLHGFRRTCLTKLVNSGLGLPTAMSIGGHRNSKSALRYQRPMEGDALQNRIEAIWS